MSIYITGDKHRDFSRIYNFCERAGTTRDDIMIILGDSGINLLLFGMDDNLKSELELMPITLFCIHGNHEERPFNIPTYEEQQWHGGTVYVEPKYPSLIFAKDGEIYDFNGQKSIALIPSEHIEFSGKEIDLLSFLNNDLSNLHEISSSNETGLTAT